MKNKRILVFTIFYLGLLFMIGKQANPQWSFSTENDLAKPTTEESRSIYNATHKNDTNGYLLPKPHLKVHQGPENQNLLNSFSINQSATMIKKWIHPQESNSSSQPEKFDSPLSHKPQYNTRRNTEALRNELYIGRKNLDYQLTALSMKSMSKTNLPTN